MSPPAPELIGGAVRYFDLTGVVGNAILGGILARKAQLDFVGFAVLAVLSGLGGGMLRDTLLQHGTPVALTDYAYLLCALGGAVVAFFVTVEGRVWNVVFPVVDALALGCWASAGAQKTVDAGLGWLPALLLGTITAVGGGAIRDVILRRTPTIFGGPLYATAALVTSGIIVVGDRLVAASFTQAVGTLVGAGLVLLARRENWQLPQPRRWQPAHALHQRARDRAGSRPARSRPTAGTHSRHHATSRLSHGEPATRSDSLRDPDPRGGPHANPDADLDADPDSTEEP